MNRTRKMSRRVIAGVGRNVAAVIAASSVVGAAVIAAAPAGAADAPSGYIGIRATGSLYAGRVGTPDATTVAYSSLPVATGSLATFSIKVTNTQLEQTQYQLNLSFEFGVDGGATLAAAGKDVTSLAERTDGTGYETLPLAPKASQTLTLKVRLPATATYQDEAGYLLQLGSPGGASHYAAVFGIATTKSTTGNSGHDLLVSTSGQASVRGGDASSTVDIASTIKSGQAAKFAAKVVNHGASPHAITLSAYNLATTCSSFPVRFAVGSVDITGPMLSSGGYTTPVLAVGKSQAITMTITDRSSTADPSCAWVGGYMLTATADDGASAVAALVNGI